MRRKTVNLLCLPVFPDSVDQTTNPAGSLVSVEPHRTTKRTGTIRLAPSHHQLPRKAQNSQSQVLSFVLVTWFLSHYIVRQVTHAARKEEKAGHSPHGRSCAKDVFNLACFVHQHFLRQRTKRRGKQAIGEGGYMTISQAVKMCNESHEKATVGPVLVSSWSNLQSACSIHRFS
jgi:hypothetical protein